MNNFLLNPSFNNYHSDYNNDNELRKEAGLPLAALFGAAGSEGVAAAGAGAALTGSSLVAPLLGAGATAALGGAILYKVIKKHRFKKLQEKADVIHEIIAKLPKNAKEAFANEVARHIHSKYPNFNTFNEKKKHEIYIKALVDTANKFGIQV